ncbi:hypothetical protein U9R62_06940 [Cylindrospermopsis raciborskii DSH]
MSNSLTSVTQIFLHRMHFAALKSDGSVVTWVIPLMEGTAVV